MHWSIGEWTDGLFDKMRAFFLKHNHAHASDVQLGERNGDFPFMLVTESMVDEDGFVTGKRELLQAMPAILDKVRKGGE